MITSIAIGSFDGMHKAHQELIGRVDGVVVIERNCATLTAGYRRTYFSDKPIYFYHFDKIKDLTPQEFIEKLRNDFPYLNKIVIGYDFAFGKNKSGNSDTIKELFSGTVEVINEIKIDGIGVHSRVIRDFISSGEISKANQFLAREYEISGSVISGQGLGANELVATINLSANNYLLPKDGIYATKTKLDDKWHQSVSFIGHRVSTDGKFAVETHILDSDIGVVRGNIGIRFVDFIRDNLKFDTMSELKNQIQMDIDIARSYE